MKSEMGKNSTISFFVEKKRKKKTIKHLVHGYRKQRQFNSHYLHILVIYLKKKREKWITVQIEK